MLEKETFYWYASTLPCLSAYNTCACVDVTALSQSIMQSLIMCIEQ